MSPQEVQDLALKCRHDFENAGAVPPQDIVFLSSMGTSGAHKPLGFQAMAYIFGVVFYLFFVSCVFECFSLFHQAATKAKHAQGLAGLCKQRLFAAKGFHAKHSFQGTLQQAIADDALATFGLQPNLPLLRKGLG